MSIKELDDVQRFINTIREFRERDIVAFNNIQQLAGYQAGFRRTTLTKTVNYAVGINDLAIDVDSTGGARTMTLLASPLDGQTHIIFKADVSANNVVVSGNGKNINGSATQSWNTQYIGKIFIFMAGSGEWRMGTWA